MHLAAADVHVIRERIRVLLRDRADLAPDTPEVLEQASALERQIRDQRSRSQNVHSAILRSGGLTSRRAVIRRRAVVGGLWSCSDAASTRASAPSLRGSASSVRAASALQERRGASRRAARLRARGSVADFSRPERSREASSRRVRRRAASVPRREPPMPLRRRSPRPSSTTSVRAARQGRSTSRRGWRSRRAAGKRSA